MSIADEIKQLDELRAEGVISQEDFDKAKASVLGGVLPPPKPVGKVKASLHESYWTFTVLALLLPMVGVIVGIVFMTKSARLDRKLGEHTLAISFLFMILWWVFSGIVVGMVS